MQEFELGVKSNLTVFTDASKKPCCRPKTGKLNASKPIQNSPSKNLLGK